MAQYIERLLNLQRGDLRRSGALFAYLFLVIAAYVVGKAARSALFLGKYAAVNLPYVTISIALLTGLVIAAYVRIARRTSLRNLQILTLVFFSLCALAIWYVAHFYKLAWLYPVFYIWVGIYGVLAPAQVWTLANYSLTTREAKRLFGVVAGGATGGFVFGGFLTRTLIGRYGTESVLIGMAVLLVLCVPLVWLMARQPRPDLAGPEEAEEGEAGRAQKQYSMADNLKLVRSSTYLRAIAAVICLSSIATTTANWQFEAFTQIHFQSDKNAIGRFLGDFYFVAGIACLLVQFLMTSRVLRRFGIGPALFVVPLGLLMGSAAILVWGTLAAAIVLRGSDQVLRYSIDKSTVELLYLPVSPQIKLPLKSFIDTVVWRLGDGLSGIAVLVFATWMGVSAQNVSWLNVTFIAGWLFAALVARRQYVETLRESIQQHRLDAERASAPVLDRSVTDLLAGRLQATDPQEIMYALSVFEVENQRAAHPAVRGLLEHPAAEVRQKAIAILTAAGDVSVRPAIENLLKDPHISVRTEALLYLARHARIDPLSRIEQLGDFADFSIRAAIVAYLAHPGPAQNLLAARVLLDKMAGETGPEGRRARIEAARIVGHLPDQFPQVLRHLLTDPEPEVAGEAIRSVGRMHKRRFVFLLLDRIAEPELTPVVVESLAEFGDSLAGTLRDHLDDPGVPIETRREIPAVLVRIGTREAARILTSILFESDTQLRFRAIQSLNRIQQAHPDVELDTQMIETIVAAEIMGHYRSYQILGTLGEDVPHDDGVGRALKESMSQEVERVFRLLGLLYPRYDLHSACFGVQSSNRIVHDNALEFLDNVLQPQLRNLLVPLLDSSVSISERVRLANKMVGARVESREEAVTALVMSDDPWLKACGAYAVGTLGLRLLEPELDRCLEHPDPLLRETARQAKLRLAGSLAPSEA